MAFVRVGGSLLGADEAVITSRVITVCRSLLADFKVPREVYALEEFPRASVGKIAKQRLREMRQERTGGRRTHTRPLETTPD